MSEVGQKVKESVHARLDVPGLMNDMLDKVVDPALSKLVADSSNPFDDALKAALYGPLVAELKKAAKEEWDKLLSEQLIHGVGGEWEIRPRRYL